MRSPFVIAYDIGGTKTIVGLVDRQGRILQQERFATDVTQSAEHQLSKCADAARRCLKAQHAEERDAAGVGITVPGLADSRSGVLLYAPYAGWRDVPVRDIVSHTFAGLPVHAANDVNACALGELVFGGAGSYDNFLWATVSTGVGGGLVVGKRIYEGERHIAGELGHIIVEWDRPKRCGCGNFGCLEAHASGTAIGAMAQALLEQAGEDGPLASFLREHGLKPTAEGAAKAAQSGVESAAVLFDEAGAYIGRAFAAAANLLNPGAFFVGGGVSLSFPLWERSMREVFERSVIGESNKTVPIVRTELGYEAGLLGAAALVFHAESNERSRP